MIKFISHIHTKNYVLLLCLFLIMILPIFYKEAMLYDININKIISSILYTLPVCFLIIAIRNRIAFSIIVVILALASCIETIMVVLFGEYINAGNILAALTTTAEEGGGFIQTSINAMWYNIPAFIACVVALYFYNPVTIQRKKLFICSFISTLFVIGFIAFQLNIKYDSNITTRFYINQNLIGRPPYNFFFQISNAIHQQHLRSYIKDSENMSFNATRTNYNGKEIYVLAIGESLRYSNMSLTGYERNTTPNLDTISNITLYSNYYSTANLTMYSVPQILTRATAQDFELNYKEKSIFLPFKECGFKTFAICCKNLLDYEKHLTKGVDSLYHVTDDTHIAPLIDSLSLVHDKTFFIVQFFGNHNPYQNFREADNVFRPNPVYDDVAWSNQEAMINAYDNTVRFTDFNVSNIIKSINKPDTQSAFVMVSDHGEDFRPGTGGHGGNCNPNKEEYHVPLIFWNSDMWIKNNPIKYERILANKNMAVNADNIFYTMCDIANIQIGKEYDNKELTITSDKLKEHERYLLTPDGSNYILIK